MAQPLPFADGFYIDESLPVAAQECVNLFPRKNEVTGDMYLRGTPGISLLDDGLAGVCRGQILCNGVPYFVAGDTLYKVNEAFQIIPVAIVPGVETLVCAHNGTWIVLLVPGGDAWAYNVETELLSPIDHPNFREHGDPLYVSYIDGYFVFVTGKRFIISEINDPLTYTALDFGSANANPDTSTCSFVVGNQLFIGGPSSIEGFQNVGGAGFPFVRSGVFISIGVLFPSSIVPIAGGIVFIGIEQSGRRSVYFFSGSGVQELSTRPISRMLHESTQTEITSWSYGSDGDLFVGIKLDHADMVYNFTTQRWHRVATMRDGINGPWRTKEIVSAYGKFLCLDREEPICGLLDYEVFDEYTHPIVRQFVTRPFRNQGKPFSVSMMELLPEAGVGSIESPNPQVVMERSLDAKTWMAPRAAPMGLLGRFRNHTIWRRIGRSFNRELFRFTFSDKVKVVVIGLEAEFR